ncbi:ATP-binding protein [Brackiella oedipodis]|uniref:ATP-binding protein n=1 Tax=Brackiella oedipodis TaxID=124225 RepID=UPI00068747F6|nr:ATP-binding protein [Brackiella oedipodis]
MPLSTAPTDSHTEDDLTPPRFKWGSNLSLTVRSFLLMTVLMIISLSAWFYFVVNSQRVQQADQLAERAASALSISQKTLSYVPQQDRPSLVVLLSTQGDTQIYPRELSDSTKPLPASAFWQLVQNHLLQIIPDSENIIIASELNGERGLWLSMTIDNDLYWLLIRHDIDRSSYFNDTLRWFAFVLALALVASVVGVQFLMQPLSRLSQNAQIVARGETPADLPVNKGPREIVELFHAFNTMVHDLRQLDSDREIMLAGISHDLRTPLARIRLEIELSGISEESRDAIDGDIEQINHCITQLMDYARPTGELPEEPLNISKLIEDLCQRDVSYTEFRGGELSYEIQPDLYARIKEINLQRVVGNLIENARRYGKDENGRLHIDVNVSEHQGKIRIDVADNGKGVDPKEMSRLLRPFARGEQARSNASGAGLGLAICVRLLKHANGSLNLFNKEPHGLICRIEIPKHKPKKTKDSL